MKEKIVFVAKCFVVLIPLWMIIIYAKYNMLGFTDNEAPNYIWNKNVCTSGHEKYDVVILGDSVANAAYMPEVLSDSCINLALGGTTPMENYYTLREYLENSEAPEKVYISFLDFHFYASDCYWLRSMYSHRYRAKDSWEMLKTAQAYNETSIAIEKAEWNWLAYELYLPNKYITSLSNAGFNQRYDDNKNSYNLNGVHGGRYISRGVEEWAATDVGYDTFYVAPLFDDYYKRLIELCLQNDIKVHIIKLPLPETDTFSEQYNQQFTDYYSNLKELYPDITVDWWNNYEARCFSDEHHMNNHGALRFSEELKNTYPDEFSNSFDGDQMDALNDGIRSENYLSEMVRWAGLCDAYSFVLYDGLDEDFGAWYGEGFYQENLVITEKMLAEDSKPVYIIGQQGYSAEFNNIWAGDGTIAVDPGDGSIYEWNPYGFSGVDILVIDNVHGQVVCEKRFSYMKLGYFVLQN